MLEEPRWGLVFEKTRWIIEKYRLSHRYVLCSEMVAHLQCFSLNYVSEKTQVKYKIVMYSIVMAYYTSDGFMLFVSSVCFHISSYSSVPMDRIFRRDSDLTCLQKVSCLHFNWFHCSQIPKLFVSVCFSHGALWVHFLYISFIAFFVLKLISEDD